MELKRPTRGEELGSKGTVRAPGEDETRNVCMAGGRKAEETAGGDRKRIAIRIVRWHRRCSRRPSSASSYLPRSRPL